jgi:hypothetical protein
MPTLINNNLTSSYEGTDSHELSASFEPLGNHSKAAIDNHFKTGHRGTA